MTMTSGRGSRATAYLLALAALGALLCVCAPAASAKKSPVAIGTGKTVINGQGNTGTALASCPKGTQAVAGGYSQTPSAGFGTPNLIDVSDSYRQSKTSWTVTGTQVAGGSGTLNAFVYCVSTLPRIKTSVLQAPIGAAARSEVTATADCPSGTKIVSGGFRKPPFLGGSFVFLSDNERATGKSWTVTAVRASTASTAPGTVYSVSYCAKGVKIKKTIGTANMPVFTAPSSPAVVLAPKCKKGSAFGGGTRSPYVAGGTDRGAFLVTDSLLVGKQWQVSGLSFGGPGAVGLPVKVSVLSYCA